MVLKRYLIYFSYIGTSFSGVQRLSPIEISDLGTVQGMIDYALSKLKTNNKPTSYVASRTDRGVHALKSALTTDLDLKGEPNPLQVHTFLNRFFDENNSPIRVNDVLLVHSAFNCRKAPLRRQYVYRFAVLKPNCLPQSKTTEHTLPIPISEKNRCFFVTESNFNYELVKTASEIFVGPQDFVSFLGKPQSQIHDENLLTTRVVYRCDIEPVTSYIPSSLNDYYNYFHLTCEGRSFLYNQVRNMVAIILAVGQGKLTIDYLQQMFLDPTPNSWPKEIEKVPAYGLYLTDIFYDTEYITQSDPAEPENSDSLVQKKNHLIRRLEILKKKKEVRSSG